MTEQLPTLPTTGYPTTPPPAAAPAWQPSSGWPPPPQVWSPYEWNPQVGWMPPAGWAPAAPLAPARYAAVGWRLIAALIDVALALGVIVGLTAIGAVGADPHDPNAAAADAAGGLIVGAGLGCTYFIVAYRRWGATLGMAFLGLRLVDARTLGRPSVGKATGRFCLCAAMPQLVALGLLIALADPHRRAWHDHACGTAVIRV